MPAVGAGLCRPHIPAGRRVGRRRAGTGRRRVRHRLARPEVPALRARRESAGELLPIPEHRGWLHPAGPMTALGRRFPTLGQGR